MNLVDNVIANALDLQYSNLPESIVETVKRSILDTLATSIAGSSADGVKELVNMINEIGGREESTIILQDRKVPAIFAALANCTMARARDLDDVHEPAAMHLSATIVPSAFVISEYSDAVKGRKITGKEFITVNAIGADFLCRLRLAGPGGKKEGGWSSETPSPLAVAIMGGRLLGYNQEKIINSLGIAYAQCAGNIQSHTEGVLTVRLQQGLGPMSGMLSLMLADNGLTGPKAMLDGKYGYYNLYMHGQFNPETLVRNLGKRFELNNVSTKAYPSCKFTHTAIYGALRIVEENEISPDDIKKVILKTNSYGLTLCGGENKIIPQSVPDAQFSYFYTVATALLKRKVFIEDFNEEAIKNEKVLAMAKRIMVIGDPEKDKIESVLSPIDIEIETLDGKHYYKSIEKVKGHPDDPMSFEELTEKLMRCSEFAEKALSEDSIRKICQLIENLEDLDDIGEILKYLRIK